MTPLPQQLEDKKKGCGCCLRIVDLGLGEELFACNKNDLCKTCKAEIAILEQAIAEMQKQRQEILDKIDIELKRADNYDTSFGKRHMKVFNAYKKSLLDIKEFIKNECQGYRANKLNQPKTEK